MIENMLPVDGPLQCVFSSMGKDLSTETRRTAEGVSCPTPRPDLLPVIPQNKSVCFLVKVKNNCSIYECVVENIWCQFVLLHFRSLYSKTLCAKIRRCRVSVYKLYVFWLHYLQLLHWMCIVPFSLWLVCWWPSMHTRLCRKLQKWRSSQWCKCKFVWCVNV